MIMMTAFTGQKNYSQEPNDVVHRRDKFDSLPSDSIYRVSFPDINSNPVDLSQFAGRPSIVVNVASQ